MHLDQSLPEISAGIDNNFPLSEKTFKRYNSLTQYLYVVFFFIVIIINVSNVHKLLSFKYIWRLANTNTAQAPCQQCKRQTQHISSVSPKIKVLKV